MPDKNSEYGFIAYIDEAGDPGLKRVRPIDKNGATEWFTLGAVVVSAENENKVVQWTREIRADANATQGPELHFRRQGPSKSKAIVTSVVKRDLRCFCVASNKQNMRGYRNQNAEQIPSQEWFYCWMTRILLERVTDFCVRRANRDGRNPKLKVILSQRGGLRYSQMRAYLKYYQTQVWSGTTVLKYRNVAPQCIDWDLIEDHPSKKIAGLQLADVVASSFFQAVNTIGPNKWDTTYAEILRDRLWGKRTWADEGIVLQPMPHVAKNILTEDQKKIFRFYGYKL